MSSANINNFTSFPFQMCIFLGGVVGGFSFFVVVSCLIALARTSNTVLNLNGESKYLVFFFKSCTFHH